MKGTDDDRMGDSHDRPFSPPTGRQALIQGRQVRPFRPSRRMGQLRQAGPQGAIAPAGFPERRLPALSSLPGATPVQADRRLAVPKRLMSALPHGSCDKT
jgi:hypothetical protein